MSENQPVLTTWVLALQHKGINKEVATILETAGSLSVLVAQLIYLSQPFLSWVVSSQSLDACARVLENSSTRQEFIARLKEGITHEPAA
jgi:hypothetical protein